MMTTGAPRVAPTKRFHAIRESDAANSNAPTIAAPSHEPIAATTMHEITTMYTSTAPTTDGSVRRRAAHDQPRERHQREHHDHDAHEHRARVHAADEEADHVEHMREQEGRESRDETIAGQHQQHVASE